MFNKWTHEERIELYTCYCLALKENLNVIHGTYSIWKRRNENIKSNMTAIQLNRFRRKVQDEITECQRKLIAKQLDEEQLEKQYLNNFNNPEIPQLCQSIDRHGTLNSSLDFIN